MHDVHQIPGVRTAARLAATRLSLSALGLSSLCFAAPAFAADPAPPAAASAQAAPAAAPAAAAAPAKKAKLPTLPCPAHVPEAINPPEDTTLELALPASGVQKYACTSAKPGDAPAWDPEGPHALLNAGGKIAAIHFGGPSWQAIDGSLVKGAKLAGADAPDKSNSQWLLLSATPTGEGMFSKITHVQRLDTVGGKAPAGGCDAAHLGTKALVPYKANYFFYRSAAAGEAVKQCRAPTPKKK